MVISSPQNAFLKNIRRAADEGRPMENGLIVAEGPHLVAEALHGGWPLRQVISTPAAALRFSELFAALDSRSGIERIEIAPRALKTISSTDNSQGIVALLEPRLGKLETLFQASAPLVVMDGIQDPGNAGTIVRSAEAFGSAGVVFMERCVRVANAKFLRAAAGSIFRLPFCEGVCIQEVIQQARVHRTVLYTLAANRQSPQPTAIPTLPKNGRFAFIVGSEGNGVSPEFIPAGETLSIPTEKVESLNAAVACSIVLFEWARQRALTAVKAP